MARSDSPPAEPRKRFARARQLWQIFQVTRKADRALVWWMLLVFVAVEALTVLAGYFLGAPIFYAVVGVPLAFMVALLVMSRRAERAAYAQIQGQPGATGAALNALRKGWTVEEQPVAVDPRTRDLVFRAVGRPGVVLVTEGPASRVQRLAEGEKRKIARVLPNVPVTVVHGGDDDGQIPLRKLSGKIGRMKPQLTKAEVDAVAKRLRALAAARSPMPIPKGIDPLRARPDRKSMRGR